MGQRGQKRRAEKAAKQRQATKRKWSNQQKRAAKGGASGSIAFGGFAEAVPDDVYLLYTSSAAKPAKNK